MVDELVFPQDISTEWLFNLLESVYIPCELKSSDTLLITEPLGCYVTISDDGKQIQLLMGFEASPEVSRDEKLEAINRLNDHKRMIRGAVEDDGDITFDYLVLTDGGVTKAFLVRTIRHFITLASIAFTTPEVMVVLG